MNEQVRAISEEVIRLTSIFSLGSGLRTTSVAFGFALECPGAHGGSENLNINILVHKLFSGTVLQFVDRLAPHVHEIHVLMDKDPNNMKDLKTKVAKL
ncbi:MAG: hypothetical protein ACTSP4_04815 [Candidatus Hodarchaeales archaeon]